MAVVSITKKELRSDLILRLTQSKPSADLELSNSQVDRWIDISRDRFLSAYLLENAKYNGFFIDNTYVTIEKSLALTAVATTDEAEFKCTVVQPILSVPLNDYGVVRVRTKLTASPYTHITCHKVDRRGLSDIKIMEFSAPDATHPVAYREGQDIYFSGLVSGADSTHTATIEYCEAMTGSDKDYSISEAHVSEITEMAEEIGRRELGLIIVDTINDGDQNQPQPTQTRR